MLLTREAALAAAKGARAVEIVRVPELGPEAEIRIVEMSAAAREEWEDHAFDATEDGKGRKAKKIGFRAWLVIASAEDDQGARLFSADDFAVLQAWPGTVMDRLALAAMRVNGLSESDEAAVKN